MSEKIKEFREYRAKMNERILAQDNLVIKRLFNLDTPIPTMMVLTV
jgi:hypothetical protein